MACVLVYLVIRRNLMKRIGLDLYLVRLLSTACFR